MWFLGFFQVVMRSTVAFLKYLGNLLWHPEIRLSIMVAEFFWRQPTILICIHFHHILEPWEPSSLSWCWWRWPLGHVSDRKSRQTPGASLFKRSYLLIFWIKLKVKRIFDHIKLTTKVHHWLNSRWILNPWKLPLASFVTQPIILFTENAVSTWRARIENCRPYSL